MRGIFLQIITLSSLSLMENCLKGPEPELLTLGQDRGGTGYSHMRSLTGTIDYWSLPL